jgi:sugar phosphate isomerase/epimerase
VELAAKSPFSPRELTQTGRRQLRKMLTDAGLRVSCLSFPTRQGYDVTENLDRRIAATRDALDLAHALGTNVVVNRIGYVSADPADPGRGLMAEALLEIARHGERCGAMLAARTGSEPGSVLADFLRAMPASALGVDFDPAGLVANRFSISDAITALAPYVVHVHARDAVYDPSEGRGVEVTVGRGSADVPLLAATLDAHGYHGYFTIQRHPTGNVIAELDDAVTYLRSFQQE